jgi:ABC-type transport system involved in multi-copper enzyme maturation permease subunit
MTFLPIVARELRVTARKRSTYWIRFAAAALALAIGGWSFLFLTQMGAASMAGQMLFGGLFGLAWLHAVLGGVVKTADTLSEEKREGTLGLLFLTDLKGYDIVLGKIVAASVNWFFGLIALFPVLALALLMGGVAPGEFWRKILAVTNLLFYSLALGMFVSSFMRSDRHAAGITIALLVLLLWLPSEAAQAHQKSIGALAPSLWFDLPDVTRPIHYAEDFLFNRNPALYWQSLGVSHAVGWIFLVLASLIVPHTWQQSAGRVSRWREQAEQFTYGKNAARRKRFRDHALSLNPFYWVAARARGQSVMLFVVLLAVCICFYTSSLFHPNDWGHAPAYLIPALVLQSVVKIWLALAACRRFVEDRRSGALELILSTPLSERDIVRGQWSALIKQFRGPLIFVLCVDSLLLFFGWAVSHGDPQERLLFVLMLAAGIIVFVADVIALAWLSMWRGLKSRHSYIAWFWSVVQLLALPWVLFYIGLTVMFMLIYLPQFMGAGTVTRPNKWMERLPQLMIGLWFIISMAMAALSAWWARRCLRKHFRYQVTLAYGRTEKVRRIEKPAALPPAPSVSTPAG